LPTGEVVRTEPVVPRASVGPNLRELFLGSEGALGVVTEVALRVHPLPEARALASFAFPSMGAALDTVRRVLRVGWRPAVLRAYDQMETERQFSAWAPADTCLLLVVSEGPGALVQAERGACASGAAAGGTISHHHGIGRLRAPWLERELGSAYPLLRALKRALDPSGIMNPGVLLTHV